ncbi:serine/Threonine-kinase [Wolffia australiana]
MGFCSMSSVVSPAVNLLSLTRNISKSPSLISTTASRGSSLRGQSLNRFTFLSISVVGSLEFSRRSTRHIVECTEYVFPDPIPEFADAETGKFKRYMLERLSKKELFKGYLEEIVGICSEILSEFLHTEYGGPGTLLVLPFIDMADIINERGLPGGPQAARAAVVWAERNIDKDWKVWANGATAR